MSWFRVLLPFSAFLYAMQFYLNDNMDAEPVYCAMYTPLCKLQRFVVFPPFSGHRCAEPEVLFHPYISELRFTELCCKFATRWQGIGSVAPTRSAGYAASSRVMPLSSSGLRL